MLQGICLKEIGPFDFFYKKIPLVPSSVYTHRNLGKFSFFSPAVYVSNYRLP